MLRTTSNLKCSPSPPGLDLLPTAFAVIAGLLAFAIDAINLGVDPLLCWHREVRQRLVPDTFALGLDPLHGGVSVARMLKFQAARAR